jgi:signal peptidase I
MDSSNIDSSNLATARASFSEEVKELEALARSLAKKQKCPHLADFHILQGFLLNVRTFSRSDALCKQLKLSPRNLLKAVKSLSPDDYKKLLTMTSDSAVLDEARQIALSQNVGGKAKVDVEHVLMALAQSSDPLVQGFLSNAGITRETVEKAVPPINKNAIARQGLFFGKEFVEVVVVVLFFLVVIKEGLGELRLIPSESMLPQLQIEDRVLIEKLSRWYRPYERGDVLVFYPPMTQLKNDPWSIFLRVTGFSGILYKKEDNIDVAYIKRLIGLPGDEIDVRPGVGVFINGEQLNEPYINEVAYTCTLMEPEETCAPVVVPEDHYFVMGDNRNQSLDSRFWGFEPKERIIGRAVWRIWPLGRIGKLPVPQYHLEPPEPQ